MNRLDYTFNLTLERMALVKIATVLWNDEDIRNRLTESFRSARCYYDSRGKRISAWQDIENIINQKVLRMLLPKSLKVKIMSYIKPIGLEIIKWLQNHLEYLAINLPSEFYWTSHGTIDLKKTAAALIEDEKIEITKRYRLACIYCLENDVMILQDKLPEHHEMLELGYVLDSYVPDSFQYSELVHIWDCILTGKIANLPHENNGNSCTPFQYAFEFAAEYGHKAAMEYFFQKLTPVEREESLVRTMKEVIDKPCEGDDPYEHSFALQRYGDVLRFLLSQMEMDNQQLLERHSFGLLECCLDWPWQGFMLETVRYVQEFLVRCDYERMLFLLIRKIKNGFKDCNYHKLFRELFNLIPKTDKTYFYVCFGGYIRLAVPSTLLPALFAIKDKENISLILKDATAAEKDKIIFCNQSKDICIDLARNNEWDLLEFFVTECIASQEKLIQFREEITEYAYVEGKTAKRKKLCISSFLNNLIQKERKKKKKS